MKKHTTTDDQPLRKMLARNPEGGSYKLRVRVPQGRGMVYRTVELGLGTRDEDTAAYIAAVVLSSIDKVFGLHTPRPYILAPDVDHVITWEQISRARKETSIKLRLKSGSIHQSARKAGKLAHQMTFDFPGSTRDNSDR